MQGPAIFIFIFSILYLIGIYTGYRDRKKGGLQILFWCLISLVIYIIGVNYFYGEVRNASTHGNTVHGWYSKSNGGEKAIAILWGVFFPIVTNGLVFLFVYKRLEKEEIKKNSIKEKQPKEIKNTQTIVHELKTNNISSDVINDFRDVDLNKSENKVELSIIDNYANDDEWWDNLSDVWKKIFNKTINIHSNQINLSNSDLIPEDKRYSNEKSVKVSGTTEKPSVENLKRITSSKELDLKGFGIVNISCLQYLNKLEKLDLSFNNIIDLSPLAKLKELNNLTIKGDYRNSGKKFINDISFLKNLKKLVTLDLSNNEINNIDSLDELRNLQILNLGGNKILSIESLINLKKLEILNLDSNFDIKINNNIIKKMRALKELRLTNLKSRAKTLFINHKKLEKLSLSSSQIKMESLNILENLVCLELRFCSKIEFEDINKLTNLNQLILEHNKLNNINFLRSLKKLNHLELYANGLEKITILKNLENLNYLKLSQNKIKNIKPLENLMNLKLLDLRFNPIKEEGIENLKKQIPSCKVRYRKYN